MKILQVSETTIIPFEATVSKEDDKNRRIQTVSSHITLSPLKLC